MRQASNTNSGPRLVTFTAPPNTRKHRRLAAVSILIKELDSLDIEGRPNPGIPLAYLDGNNIVVQVLPGVSSVGAVKKMIRRAIPRVSYSGAVPMPASAFAMS